MTLVPIDPSSAVAVTDYLTKARDWLATAVENTGPEQIAAAKAEIATAAEATRQLGLSREIQEDAAEMVRRAEWALRRSQKKAQAAGEMADRNTNLRNNPRNDGTSISTGLPRPREMFATEVEYRDSLAMGELEQDDFEAVLAKARAEGNLSRANVARKAREAVAAEPSKPRRRPLPDAARDAGWDLRKSVERLERIAVDDRFSANAEQVAPHLRSHLNHAIEVCQDLLARINNN